MLKLLPISLNTHKGINSPILGSTSFYFATDLDVPIEAKCARNIQLQPNLFITVFPDRSTQFTAIKPVDSIEACIENLKHVADAIGAGQHVAIEYQTKREDYWSGDIYRLFEFVNF